MPKKAAIIRFLREAYYCHEITAADYQFLLKKVEESSEDAL